MSNNILLHKIPECDKETTESNQYSEKCLCEWNENAVWASWKDQIPKNS